MSKKVPVLLPIYILWITIKKFWNGEKKLVSAFWGLGIFGSFLLILLVVTIATNIEHSPWFNILFPLIVIYYFFTLKVIWACSKNTKKKVWGDVAKILVIIHLCLVIIKIFSSNLKL